MILLFEKPVTLCFTIFWSTWRLCVLEILLFIKAVDICSEERKHFQVFRAQLKFAFKNKALSMQSTSFLGACVSLSLLRRDYYYFFLQKHLYWPPRLTQLNTLKVSLQKIAFQFQTMRHHLVTIAYEQLISQLLETSNFPFSSKLTEQIKDKNYQRWKVSM